MEPCLNVAAKSVGVLDRMLPKKSSQVAQKRWTASVLQPEQPLPPLTPIKHVDKQAALAPAGLWPSGMFVEHAEG